jgi:hypothetical protein
LLFIPAFAFASGSEVLELLWLELLALIVILIVLFRGELNGVGKVSAVFAFWISTVAAFYMTRNLSYGDNAYLVLASTVGLPFCTFILVYLGFSKYLEKRAEKLEQPR